VEVRGDGKEGNTYLSEDGEKEENPGTKNFRKGLRQHKIKGGDLRELSYTFGGRKVWRVSSVIRRRTLHSTGKTENKTELINKSAVEDSAARQPARPFDTKGNPFQKKHTLKD